MEEARTYGEILEKENPRHENNISKMTAEEKELFDKTKSEDKERLLNSSGNNKSESITFNKPIKNTRYIPGIGNVTQMM